VVLVAEHKARIEVLLQGLDAAQRSAVEAKPAPLVVVAGAGSGKTTTLVRRIAYMVEKGWVEPGQVLAVSHTTKASGEISERLKKFDGRLREVHCHTVHAVAWKIVRELGNTNPELVTSTYPMVRDALRSVSRTHADDTTVVSDVVSEIEWARARCMNAKEYAEYAKKVRRTPPVSVADIVSTWERYERAKRERNLMDFADVIEEAAAILLDPTSGNRVRARYQAVVVDEFQDTDLAQSRMLNALRANRPLWAVVGDPRQTIYSFKGADPSILEEAAREADVSVVHLATSYRCGSTILGAANSLIGSKYGPALESVTTSPGIALQPAYNDEDEVTQVVGKLRELSRRGVAFEEMAVLYRFNASSPRFEAGLTEAGIPYQMTGSAKFFERPDVLAVLRVFGANARQAPDSDGVAMLLDAARETGWDRDNAPSGAGARRIKWEMILALVELAERSSQRTAMDLLQHLQFLSKTGGGVGVTLGTIHAAKGLEWDAVVVAGLVEGQLPSAYATTPEELEEERRLLYVAVTRARQHLVLSYPKNRYKRPVEVSRFVAMLGLKVATTARTTTQTTRKRAAPSSTVSPATARMLDESFNCATCGKKLTGAPARVAKACSGSCLKGAHKVRWDSLHAWRAALAEQLGEHADDVVTERALFRYAVLAETGLGWRPSVKPPQL
jgi:DNA helicase-2/ATP-dependent DNA helicase PcrA